MSALTSTMPRRRVGWSIAPLLLLLIAGVLANAGVGVTKDARAASANTTVEATVGAVASTAVADCGGGTGTLTITFTQNTFMNGTCTVTFGSSNTSGITLSAVDSTTTDAFWPLNTANFADATATCNVDPLAVDSIGMKVNSGGTSTRNFCSATAAQAGTTNAGYTQVPKTSSTVCTTSAAGTQTCPIGIGLFETGSNAPAGSYTGTINITSSG